MSESTSTKPVATKTPESSTHLKAGSFDNEAERLIEDVFSDVDRVLDPNFGLPEEPLQPKTVAVNPVRVPPIVMRPLVIPQPSAPPQDATQSAVSVNATPTKTADTAGETFDRFLLGAACASLVATLGLWIWRDEVQQFVQNRLMPTQAEPVATPQQVEEDPQETADREFIDYMERSLERINSRFAGGGSANTSTSGASQANPSPGYPTLSIPIDPASIDDIAGSLKEIATVLSRNTTTAAVPRLPQPPNANNPTPPSTTANNAANNANNNNNNGNNADSAGATSPAPAAAPAAAPAVPALAPTPAAESSDSSGQVASSAAPAEPDYSESDAGWEPDYSEDYTEDYSEPEAVWEPEYSESEPAPDKPAVATNPEPAEAAPPANVHTLMGFLEFGDRSAALFEINGVAQRINVGESVGASGWSLVEV
ncbi:MAG: hypothetical protein SWY16_11235, partial [Cyanobacteriota bacterium]|nr:hypothetical protein [Cyanobacteriota bacterium]